MRLPKIFSAVAAATILFVSSNISAEPKAIDLSEGVDWTKRTVTAKGVGFAPTNAINFKQAEGLALKAAQAEAYRKLGELVNGVHVEGNRTVENMITTQDKIQLSVSATIKGAKIVGQDLFDSRYGSCSVTMQVPLFGSSNSLANAVLERPTEIEPFPDPVVEVEPTNFPYNSLTPINRRIALAAKTQSDDDPLAPLPDTNKLPLSRMSLPTIVKGASGQPIKKSVEEYASMAQGDYTGLIVDCRGLNLQPVMSPVILNTNGTKIYGHKNLDPDKVVSIGMVDYVTDSENVSRAGDNPLVVKAVKLENFNSNPVLSLADSNRVLIENHATKFLKELKVVFLFD